MMSKSKIFQVKDHLVSGETFNVSYDQDSAFGYTQIKDGTDLSDYYPKINYASYQINPVGIKGKLYILAQNLMLAFKLNILKRNQSGLNLLDIGGGIGVFAEYVNKKGYYSTLIEPSPLARMIAEEKHIKSHELLDQIPTDIEFDTLTLWHVLEHINDLNNTLEKCFKLLKNKGLIIIAVPNLNSFDARYYGPYWAALDVPRHLWHFTPRSINQLLEKHGFDLVKTYPMWFDAIYISIISETYSGNNLAFLKGIFIGLYSNLRAILSGEYSSMIFVFRRKS